MQRISLLVALATVCGDGITDLQPKEADIRAPGGSGAVPALSAERAGEPDARTRWRRSTPNVSASRFRPGGWSRPSGSMSAHRAGHRRPRRHAQIDGFAGRSRRSKQRGLVTRRPNLDDRREELLALTPEGRAIYEALAPQALAFEERLLSVLTPRSRRRSRALMDKLTRHARMLAPGEGRARREALHLFPLLRRLSGQDRPQSEGRRLRVASRSTC